MYNREKKEELEFVSPDYSCFRSTHLEFTARDAFLVLLYVGSASLTLKTYVIQPCYFQPTMLINSSCTLAVCFRKEIRSKTLKSSFGVFLECWVVAAYSHLEDFDD